MDKFLKPSFIQPILSKACCFSVAHLLFRVKAFLRLHAAYSEANHTLVYELPLLNYFFTQLLILTQ